MSGLRNRQVIARAFGRRLRWLRHEYGVGQDELARRSGLHRTAVSLLERGLREPRLTTILRLARSLDVAPQALVCDIDARGERDDEDVSPAEFGERLRALREQAALAHDDLADRAAVAVSTVYKIESGERDPRLTTILRLARGLGVEPDELVNGL